MNKIFIYARPCVYKMTSAFFLTGCRVSVLLSCSAVFLLFKIWKKPAKDCPIFSIGIDFLGPDPTSSKNKAEKNLQVARFANLNKNVACFDQPIGTFVYFFVHYENFALYHNKKSFLA